MECPYATHCEQCCPYCSNTVKVAAENVDKSNTAPTVYSFPEPPIPPTTKTGNSVIDWLNRTLDGLFDPSQRKHTPKHTQSVSHTHPSCVICNPSLHKELSQKHSHGVMRTDAGLESSGWGPIKVVKKPEFSMLCPTIKCVGDGDRYTEYDARFFPTFYDPPPIGPETFTRVRYPNTTTRWDPTPQYYTEPQYTMNTSEYDTLPAKGKINISSTQNGKGGYVVEVTEEVA